MRDMFASRTVAFLASNIPFSDFLGLDVVVDGMASVARRSCWPVSVVRTVVRNPPVSSRLNVIGQPTLLGDIPLSWQRVVIVASFGEVALLVSAAVYKCYLVQPKGADGIGMGKIAKNRVGMRFGIANNIGHAGLLPAVELLQVTRFATL